MLLFSTLLEINDTMTKDCPDSTPAGSGVESGQSS